MEDFGGLLFLIIAVNAFFCGFIGHLIDKRNGFAWGFFLGQLGWIIAAILKSGQQRTIDHHVTYVTTSSSPTTSYAKENQNLGKGSLSELKFDVKKWDVLKEVDPEISAAVDKVREIDVALESKLAEKYLILGQKEYLGQIVEALIKSRESQIAEEQDRKKFLEEKYSETAILEVLEYEKSLGKDKFDEKYGATALDVQVYDGSWVGWKGGVVVELSDGRTLLRRKSLSRIFPKGDDSWK